MMHPKKREHGRPSTTSAFQRITKSSGQSRFKKAVDLLDRLFYITHLPVDRGQLECE